MIYVLFLGFKKIAEFKTFEEAKLAIAGTGIFNICTVKEVDGKKAILSRSSFLINKKY